MEQLATIGKLASGIVHEIRNPLASISGSIELIGEGKQFNASEKKLISIILREVRELNSWTEEFLSFAKPGRPELIEINLKQLIEETVELMQNENIDKTFSIVFNSDDNAYQVLGDYQQLKRVFRNLFKNSIEAVPDNGLITVTLKNDNDKTIVKITDTGKGFDIKTIGKVFEPFFTTKEGGTGLGLAIVQRIIEDHNGEISIYNNHPNGAVVEVLLPRIINA